MLNQQEEDMIYWTVSEIAKLLEMAPIDDIVYLLLRDHPILAEKVWNAFITEQLQKEPENDINIENT